MELNGHTSFQLLPFTVLLLFSVLLFGGCLNALTVDKEYCENNQHLIACQGGEVVWDAGRNTCRCACDEGKWGLYCQYDEVQCIGTISIHDRGYTECDCSTLPRCESRFIFLHRNNFCVCTASLEDDMPRGEDDIEPYSRLANAKASNGPDYFPLLEGNSWSYEILDNGNTTSNFSMWIEEHFVLQNTEYFGLSLALPDSTNTLDTLQGPLMINSGEDANEVHLDFGDSGSSLLSYHQFPDDGSYMINEEEITIESIGTVTVPAGTFMDCKSLKDGATDNSFIYAPDVGLIKTVSEGADNMVLTAFTQGCTLDAEASLAHLSCENAEGTITLSVFNANGPLSYNWTGPTPIGNTPNATGLSVGFYDVTISDGACRITLTEIPIFDMSGVIELEWTVHHVSCNGGSDGSIDISVPGDENAYSYSWNEGLFTTQDLTNVPGGSYTLVVTNNEGCMEERTFALNHPAKIEIEQISEMMVSCRGAADGMIEISASGGTPPYTYDWNGGQYQTASISGLPIGDYEVIVTDANGCSSSKTFSSTIRSSQLPLTLNIQGLLTDPDNEVINDGTYDLHFGLYHQSIGGAAEWTETHLDQAVNNGIFSVILGSIVTLDLCFDQQYYLGVTVGDETEMEPRIELTAAPYSFIAKTVDDGSITSDKMKDNAVTIAKIAPDVLSGINGVRNDGGEITLKAGDNTTITPNPEDQSITIGTTVNDDPITADKVVPDIVSSLNGVKNDGGNIALLPGDNITITPDDNANTITISATMDAQEFDQFWQSTNGGISYKGNDIYLLRADNSTAVRIARVGEGDVGYLSTLGPNGTANTQLTSLGTDANLGFITVNNENGDNRALLYVNEEGNGSVLTSGPNGNLNTALSALSANTNHGFISVRNAAGSTKAGLYVDEEGNGRVFADVIDSFVDHPTKSNVQIRNSALQGPEVALYLRGTALLIDGIAKVDFPESFTALIDQERITVMITPLSAQSKGIAVIKKGVAGFRVQELLDGKGSYQFDWEVKGVRKGFGNTDVFKSNEKGQDKDERPIDPDKQ